MSTSNPVRSTVRLLAFACLFVVAAHCSLLTIRAQSATATLSGTVADEKGAVVPGVAVIVTNSATGLRRETTTNDQGSFVVALLPPSTYKLRVEHTGFALVEIPSVVLNVGDQKALRVQLRAGGVSETVLVEDSSSIKTDGAVGTVVDRQFVENLPLNGRSFQSLITLTPGVVLTKTNSGGEQGQFSVNGQRADANYFTVDGVSANIGVPAGTALGQGGAGALPGLSASGGTNSLVSVDALQEFRIQTSTYAPEFGRTPGGQVQIVTRGGTNSFRGTLFEYFRNDALDANDYFANREGLPKPALRQNDFGGVLSGPLPLPRFGEGGPSFLSGKNRTFFFFSYEGLRLRLPQTVIVSVPSVAVRQNAPAPVQPFLNAYPLPNGKDLGNGLAQFNGSYSDPSALNATSIRVDHTVSDKFALFGRYNYAPSETDPRGGTRSLSSRNPTQIKTQTLTGGATWALTPTISNEFRGNWSRNGIANFFEIDNFGGAVPPPDSVAFPPFASPQDSGFTFFVSGLSNSSFLLGKNADSVQHQINLVDNLSIVKASHQLKFGLDYRRLFPVYAPLKYSLLALFNGIGVTAPGVPPPSGSVLSGKASLISILSNADSRFPVFNNYSIYGQDTWKVAQRLTLTYGLRWEVNPSPSESKGNDAFAVTQTDNPANLALAPRGTPLYQTTYSNFAPRIGVAYQLSQRHGRESILRGGYGIFYDLGTGQAAEAYNNSPFLARKNLFSVPFPLDPTLIAPPQLSLNPPYSSVVAFDPKHKLPYSHQWNVSIEQSLGANQSVSASYVAALGRRLLRQDQLQNPNPNFVTVLLTRNTATSDYHALQLQFRRRLSRGLQALASYTWSKSLDNASDGSSRNVPVQNIDLRQERGPSNFDVRHAFNGAVTYNLPTPSLSTVGSTILRNWAVDTIITARSATPVNIVTGTDPFGLGLSGASSVSRPDLVSGQPLYIDDPTVAGGRRINRATFSIPPAGRQGTLGRNALRSFPLYQVDLALRRQFSLTERVKLQFRAEFFNLFNHPNFADPDNILQSGSTPNPFFGQSRSMLNRGLGGSSSLSGGFSPLYQVGGPRSTQFTLKIHF